MSLNHENVFQQHGTKKRMVMHHELEGKFKSKSDFLKYFKECRKWSCANIIFMSSTTLCASSNDDQ